MTFAYISSLKTLSFQNSKCFKIPLLMNFSFSTNFEASFPNRKKGTSFEIPLGNLKQPWSSNFHNQIVGPSLGLHIEYVWNTLYNIISHLIKSTKNMCVQTISHVHLSNILEPKIWNLGFFELVGEWMAILAKA